MFTIHYQKRSNTELFRSFENTSLLNLQQPQNYIPIYTRFFSLNNTNSNTINLNNKWYLYSVKHGDPEGTVFQCCLKNERTKKTRDQLVFFKIIPLLDPLRYLTGRQPASELVLPTIDSTSTTCPAKIMDPNNSSYVDSFFVYLSGQLNFLHNVEYYGSYLGMKKNFKCNVYDDIDYLLSFDYFLQHRNTDVFQIEDYDHLFNDEDEDLYNNGTNANTCTSYQSNKATKRPVAIGGAFSLKSVADLDDSLFEDVFCEEPNTSEIVDEVDIVDLTTKPFDSSQFQFQSFTLKSTSECSSRSSHTEPDFTEDAYENLEEDGLEPFAVTSSEEVIDDTEGLVTHTEGLVTHTEGNTTYTEATTEPPNNNNNDNNNDNDNEEDTVYEDCDDSSFDEEDECILATIPSYPVQVVAMEQCEQTLDDLIMEEDLTTKEWLSAFMQIIMTLLTYQKVFLFTHNDLHTNNVMFVRTHKKHIVYRYEGLFYKVPTFGRLFKIIDFGRSIYKVNGKFICSDSFKEGENAATQYNCEPYFDPKKTRVEPNFSFDLCRLACSLFNYVITDLVEARTTTDVVKRLVYQWCLDDRGVNILYKNTGEDRYPDFKLYKMIARCVHNHTPQAQLQRPEFQSFLVSGDHVGKMQDVVDIDAFVPMHAK